MANTFRIIIVLLLHVLPAASSISDEGCPQSDEYVAEATSEEKTAKTMLIQTGFELKKPLKLKSSEPKSDMDIEAKNEVQSEAMAQTSEQSNQRSKERHEQTQKKKEVKNGAENEMEKEVETKQTRSGERDEKGSGQVETKQTKREVKTEVENEPKTLPEVAVIGRPARLLYLLSPLFLAAAICAYRSAGASKSDQFGATAAMAGLRFWAALWIVAKHATLEKWQSGGFAVGLFFIVSGASLSTSRRKSPGVMTSEFDSVQSYLKFLFLRLSRILPVYWAIMPFFIQTQFVQEKVADESVSLMSFWSQVVPVWIDTWKQHPEMFMLSWGWDQDGGIAWFVKVITMLYVCYPMLERVALGPTSSQPASARIQNLFVGISVVKVVTVSCLAALAPQPFGYINDAYPFLGSWSLYALLRLPEFMLGILVPHLVIGPEKSFLASWAPVFTDILFALTTLAFFLPWAFEGRQRTFEHFCGEAPILAMAVWGFCFGSYQSPLGQILSTPWMVTASEWSYGIYLCHSQILTILGVRQSIMWDFCGGLLATYLLAMLVSWAFFVLVDKPAGQMARQMLTRLQ
jgi:peptidoglycan/LPS O-acetylase OafA/YrhL